MMAYLDREMTPRQRRAFEELLEEHPEWREELSEMAELVGATNQLRMRPPSPDVWDNYWEEIDSELHRGFGWTVALVGSLILIVWGFVKVIAFAENDLVRTGILLIALGFGILFLTVLRGRIIEFSKDRYRRIRR
jgi:ferric-dicitrate binding protein FerR (iron transport regulator)